MRRYREALACDLMVLMLLLQCLRSLRHRSAHCSVSSSNSSSGNWKTAREEISAWTGRNEHLDKQAAVRVHWNEREPNPSVLRGMMLM